MISPKGDKDVQLYRISPKSSPPCSSWLQKSSVQRQARIEERGSNWVFVISHLNRITFTFQLVLSSCPLFKRSLFSSLAEFNIHVHLHIMHQTLALEAQELLDGQELLKLENTLGKSLYTPKCQIARKFNCYLRLWLTPLCFWSSPPAEKFV